MKFLLFENVQERVGPQQSADHVVSNPDWPAVENAIRALDGKDRSYVMLAPDRNASEQLSLGSHEGRYFCFFYDGDEYNLVDPHCAQDGTVQVLLGQHSIRSKKELVDLQTALIAARTYFNKGTRDPSLTWKLQE